MKRLVVRMVPALVLLVLATPLVAQQRRPGGMFGGGGVAGLLNNKGVQEELKLSDEQKTKLTDAVKDTFAKYKEDLSAARKDKNREKTEQLTKAMNADLNKVAAGTLKPEQLKRLHQIEIWAALQRGNLEVLTQERIQKALKLTDKQKDMIKETSETLNKDRREAFQNAGMDREKMQEAMKKIGEKSKSAVEKFLGGLSPDQKSAFKALTGEKFEVKFEQRRRPQ